MSNSKNNRVSNVVGSETNSNTSNGTLIGLSDVERATMGPANVSESEINEIDAARRLNPQRKNRPGSGSRVEMKKLIFDHAEEIMTQGNGKPLHLGSNIGKWMADHGFYPSMKRNNAWGDVLGGHGLSLPSVMFNGRKFYDLSQLGKSKEEMEVRKGELSQLGHDVISTLVAKID